MRIEIMNHIKGILDMKKLFISCVALIVVVAMMSRVAEARPGWAANAANANSCTACHTDETVTRRLTVLGDGLITLPGDPNGRGEIPFFDLDSGGG